MSADTGGRDEGQGPTGRARKAAPFLLMALLALAIVAAGSARPLAERAETRLQEVALASTAVYASLRTINAAISLVQETELGASIAVSGNVRPLAWLDPVDDTVERVAALIFWISLAAGLLSLAVTPLATLGWLLVAAACLLRAAACLWPGTAGRAMRLGERGVAVPGAGFLLLPLVVIAGLALGERMTQDRWATAMAQLGDVTEAAEPVVAPFEGAPTPSEGLLDGVRGGIGGMREAIVGFQAAAGVFRQDAQALFVALLTISGVFLLRMIVLPAALLWAALSVLRRML